MKTNARGEYVLPAFSYRHDNGTSSVNCPIFYERLFNKFNVCFKQINKNTFYFHISSFSICQVCFAQAWRFMPTCQSGGIGLCFLVPLAVIFLQCNICRAVMCIATDFLLS